MEATRALPTSKPNFWEECTPQLLLYQKQELRYEPRAHGLRVDLLRGYHLFITHSSKMLPEHPLHGEHCLHRVLSAVNTTEPGAREAHNVQRADECREENEVL